MITKQLPILFILGASLLVFGLAVFAMGQTSPPAHAPLPAVSAPPADLAAETDWEARLRGEAATLEHEPSALGLLGAVTGAGILVVAWQRWRRLETAAES